MVDVQTGNFMHKVIDTMLSIELHVFIKCTITYESVTRSRIHIYNIMLAQKKQCAQLLGIKTWSNIDEDIVFRKCTI